MIAAACTVWLGSLDCYWYWFHTHGHHRRSFGWVWDDRNLPGDITLYFKRTWRSKNDTWVSFCFIACKSKFCAYQFGFSAALMTHIQRNLLSFWDKQLDEKIRLQPTSYFLSAIIKMCRKLLSWLWSWKERCWRIFFRVLCFNVKRWLFFPTLQSTKQKNPSLMDFTEEQTLSCTKAPETAHLLGVLLI